MEYSCGGLQLHRPTKKPGPDICGGIPRGPLVQHDRQIVIGLELWYIYISSLESHLCSADPLLQTVEGFPWQIYENVGKTQLRNERLSIEWCHVTQNVFSPLALGLSIKRDGACYKVWHGYSRSHSCTRCHQLSLLQEIPLSESFPLVISSVIFAMAPVAKTLCLISARPWILFRNSNLISLIILKNTSPSSFVYTYCTMSCDYLLYIMWTVRAKKNKLFPMQFCEMYLYQHAWNATSWQCKNCT